MCDQLTPLKDVKVRGSSLLWITNTILLKINLRYKLFKLAVNTRCLLKLNEYKTIRNEITTDLRQAKTKYFNNLFCEVEATKAYWNFNKKATAPRQQTVVDPLKTESSHLVVKDDDKACLMNTYTLHLVRNWHVNSRLQSCLYCLLIRCCSRVVCRHSPMSS